ncbi:hypothetical protein [Emticicia agri]|uniref:Uncharacterized protein n=1 Tax=Emticicia agri TaxID=2492393 RepID=A0A4Q5LVP0_9BACT|nr:hypothetical protein [Emticicia agri]RYU93788.1 hypothetical protein EWM59_20495 [Emticicia agri]
MENSNPEVILEKGTSTIIVRDSLALERVKKHSYLDTDTRPSSTEKTRQEGVRLNLDELLILIDFLKQNYPHINYVSFMIGKIEAKDGGRELIERHIPRGPEDEYTVEVLPYELKEDGTTELLTVDKQIGDDIIRTIGFLTIPNTNFDNDAVTGGGGGNQKTPPPSVRTP